MTNEEEPMGTVTMKRSQERQSAAGQLIRIPVQLWLAVVLMAMSFGAGVIVKAMAEPPAAPAIGTQQPVGQVLAPPLTDQQIQGGVPSGHPDLSGGGTGTGSGGGTGSGSGGGTGSGSGGGQG